MSYTVDILHNGYSRIRSDGLVMEANCSCCLITGKHTVIVDTMTPWDKDFIVSELEKRGVNCDDVEYAVSTHGHIDHIGNLNLFTSAQHILGFSISTGTTYKVHPFDAGKPYVIDDGLEIIPTPGHTMDHVSVKVTTASLGIVIIAGDLFEHEEDLKNENLWKYVAGSENPDIQQRSRSQVLQMADYIIPGHGPMFKVTPDMREQASSEVTVLSYTSH